MTALVGDPWSHVDLADPESVIAQAVAQFKDRLAIANSFSVEDVLLVDMAWRIWPRVRVFSLDTGRLPEQSYEVAQALRQRGVHIEWQHPDAHALRVLNDEDGPYGFRESLEARHRCCGVRKVQPLGRLLRGLDAWVTGQRRDQSVTRRSLDVLEVDSDGGPLKINPLATWSSAQVWAEATRRGLPTHGLYDAGYTSIGCAPCTRAVSAGEDERAGRWWWEAPEHKECGIHSRARDTESRKEEDHDN